MNFFLLRETLRMAARALVANRMRTVLALLGIVIGVGTVIGMVALINGSTGKSIGPGPAKQVIGGPGQ